MSDQPSILDTDADIQDDTTPLEIENGNNQDKDKQQEQQQVKKPTLLNEQLANPVPRTMSAWNEYYDKMGEARQKIIARLGEQKEFHITLQPVYDMRDRDTLLEPDEKRVFERKKISTKDFWKIEEMRSVMREASKKRPEAVRDLMLELYEEMAYIYLRNKETSKTITKAEFERMHWPITKAILDACNLASVGGQVPLDEKI